MYLCCCLVCFCMCWNETYLHAQYHTTLTMRLLIFPCFLLHKPRSSRQTDWCKYRRKLGCIRAGESAPLSPDNILLWVLLAAFIRLTSVSSQTICAKPEAGGMKGGIWWTPAVSFKHGGGVWRTRENFREVEALQRWRAVKLRAMDVWNRYFWCFTRLRSARRDVALALLNLLHTHL